MKLEKKKGGHRNRSNYAIYIPIKGKICFDESFVFVMFNLN